MDFGLKGWKSLDFLSACVLSLLALVTITDISPAVMYSNCMQQWLERSRQWRCQVNTIRTAKNWTTCCMI